MAEIISIDGSRVKVGLDSGKIKVVPLATLTFPNPKVGDEVRFYAEGNDIVISKLKPHKHSEGIRRVNKTVYVLLVLFTGILGVHRFMRGQIGLGILYILTFGLLSIGVWVDFIVSLTKLSKYEDDYIFTSNGSWV